MRFTALVPMVCAMAAFVLGMLCLFAGHKPGFMEEYHIVTLNTSTLGHNLLDATSTTTSSGSKPSSTSLGSLISGFAHNITSSIEGDLNSIEGDIADKLAKELGIRQWYSLHLMDLCEGNYEPNATAKDAKKNGTSTTCTNQTAMYHFDLETILNQELEIGSLHINVSDIGFSSDIQNGLNKLNIALNATFVLYALAIASAGLAIITSLLAVFLSDSRLMSLGNFSIAFLSFFTFLVASIVVTVVMVEATKIINKYGNDIGLYAYKGGNYLALTWVAVGVMLVACAAWIGEFCVGRRNKSREYTEKRGSRGSYAGNGNGGRHWWEGKRRSDEASLRRSGV